MKKQELPDVKKYLLECLRHKYGTYVGKCGENKLELLNDWAKRRGDIHNDLRQRTSKN